MNQPVINVILPLITGWFLFNEVCSLEIQKYHLMAYFYQNKLYDKVHFW
jgi:hypothetical protein